MAHYPNPFDFVPFPPTPFLCKEEEFDAMGDRISGYLGLKIKALTPVHIVGKVEAGPGKNRSFMYRQDDRPCIPASSIRGCLRAFTEAVTAGWASKWNTVYPKVYGKDPDARGGGRHIGFSTFEEYKPPGRSRGRISPTAVSPGFKPGLGEGKIDVASYLFGLVIEGKQEGQDDQARRSKVWIEDAYFSPKDVAPPDDLWMPDIEGSAFMGGAKPSASNWWYFLPAEIWERNSPAGTVVEFVGERFRGRKFYYHQDPIKCVSLYNYPDGRWSYSDRKPFRRVNLESMLEDSVTEPFRIYLDNVPLTLLKLLLMVLFLHPNATMRHKIGYAKAYGYGSIEFKLESAMIRREKAGIPDTLKRCDIMPESWSEEDVAKSGLTGLIDRKALTWLARILGWPHEEILFMYPRFKKGEFQQAVKVEQFTQKVKNHKLPKKVNFDEACDIASALWDLKRPIDFRLYQEKADNWDKISRRIP